MDALWAFDDGLILRAQIFWCYLRFSPKENKASKRDNYVTNFEEEEEGNLEDQEAPDE